MSETIDVGGMAVPLLHREWKRHASRLPYRKTYRLKPGDNWHDAEVTEEQWEHYVHTDEGPIPVGAMIARELMRQGADTAVFTECWGRGCVLMNSQLACVAGDGELSSLLHRLKEANGNRWRGLPDVIALFPDNRVSMREAKVAGKDRVSQTQHDFARVARGLLGSALDLAIVVWGKEAAS